MKTKVIAVKIPHKMWVELSKIARERTVESVKSKGLKTSVSGIVREMITEGLEK